jgi:methionine sulfoxide reductase heme-binding subunit
MNNWRGQLTSPVLMTRKICPTFKFKYALFICALLPFLLMVADIITDDLGANPVEELLDRSGVWALRFLLITLSVSPARMLFRKLPVMKYRRMLGLFTFFYSTVHLLVFLVFDHSLNGAYILEAIVRSPAVDIGLMVYLILIPLTVTSTNQMMRLMGKRWAKLHNLVHTAALLSIMHFVFSEKVDISIPLFYGAFLLFLQIIRIIYNKRKQNALLKRLNLQRDSEI